MKAPTNTNSRVIAQWIDPDGAPIVVTLTGTTRVSRNNKTGDLLQVSITRSDQLPSVAARSGDDQSVCGSCRLRPSIAKPGSPRCYVKLWRGIDSVWKSIVATGAAVTAIGDLLAIPGCRDASRGHRRGRCIAERHTTGKPVGVRLGAYGDPGFIPIELIRELCPPDRLRTGYTHRWREIPIAYADFMMASIDPVTHPDPAAARREANAAGWSTYRVRQPGEQPLPGAIECPHTTHGIACADCGLCAGSTSWKSGKRRAPINVEVPALA